MKKPFMKVSASFYLKDYDRKSHLGATQESWNFGITAIPVDTLLLDLVIQAVTFAMKTGVFQDIQEVTDTLKSLSEKIGDLKVGAE